MSDYEHIILGEDKSVAVLTLNNPEKRNPLTDETKTEMISALGVVAQNDNIRALVITGPGPALCAGGDV